MKCKWALLSSSSVRILDSGYGWGECPLLDEAELDGEDHDECPLLDEAELDGDDQAEPRDRLSRHLVGLGGPEEEQEEEEEHIRILVGTQRSEES